MPIIEVSGLNFEYPGKIALQDVSFTIEPKTITALVGPNGAGKTTLMSCLAALAQPVSGKIHIGGISVLDEPRRCHKMLGYLPDFFGLYDELTVKQCLTYVALSQKLSAFTIEKTVAQTAERVGIEEHLNKKAGALSRGLRQSLAIGQAIIHDPELLLLDEPASGLDPEARHNLSNLLQTLQSEGKTIVVSSHILSELEDYSTHMLVIRDGKSLGYSKIGEIKLSQKKKMVLTLTETAAKFAERMRQFDSVENLTDEATRIEFDFDDDPQTRRDLLKRLVNEGFPVCGFTEKEVDLQEIYIDKYAPEKVKK
jgi:ABC-2 type transport system ATP-binding protein